MEDIFILIEMSQKCFPRDPIDNMQSLVQAQICLKQWIQYTPPFNFVGRGYNDDQKFVTIGLLGPNELRYLWACKSEKAWTVLISRDPMLWAHKGDMWVYLFWCSWSGQRCRSHWCWHQPSCQKCYEICLHIFSQIEISWIQHEQWNMLCFKLFS